MTDQPKLNECVNLPEEDVSEAESMDESSDDEDVDPDDWPCMLHWPYVLQCRFFPLFLILVDDQQYKSFINAHVLNCDDEMVMTLESTELGIEIEFTKESDNFEFRFATNTPKAKQFVLPFASDVKRGKYVLTVEAMRNLLTQPFRRVSNPNLMLAEKPEPLCFQLWLSIQFDSYVELDDEDYKDYRFCGYLKPTPSNDGKRVFPDLQSVLDYAD